MVGELKSGSRDGEQSRMFPHICNSIEYCPIYYSTTYKLLDYVNYSHGRSITS